MDRRALSLGGFAVAGLLQVVLAAPRFVAVPGFRTGLQLLVGLLLTGLFGASLVRGDDVNGLARRPLFVVLGAASAVIYAVLVALALFGG